MESKTKFTGFDYFKVVAILEQMQQDLQNLVWRYRIQITCFQEDRTKRCFDIWNDISIVETFENVESFSLVTAHLVAIGNDCTSDNSDPLVVFRMGQHNCIVYIPKYLGKKDNSGYCYSPSKYQFDTWEMAILRFRDFALSVHSEDLTHVKLGAVQ